jgi:hypothetical protein
VTGRKSLKAETKNSRNQKYLPPDIKPFSPSSKDPQRSFAKNIFIGHYFFLRVAIFKKNSKK